MFSLKKTGLTPYSTPCSGNSYPTMSYIITPPLKSTIAKIAIFCDFCKHFPHFFRIFLTVFVANPYRIDYHK